MPSLPRNESGIAMISASMSTKKIKQKIPGMLTGTRKHSTYAATPFIIMINHYYIYNDINVNNG